MGDVGFLTQLPCKDSATVTSTACFYTSFPRAQKARIKATTNKTHHTAGTPDFMTSVSHAWHQDSMVLINGCFRALQTAPRVTSCTAPVGAIHMDYVVNGDPGVVQHGSPR